MTYLCFRVHILPPQFPLQGENRLFGALTHVLGCYPYSYLHSGLVNVPIGLYLISLAYSGLDIVPTKKAALQARLKILRTLKLTTLHF